MEILIVPIAMSGVVLYVLLSNPKTRNIARNSIMFQSSLKNNGVNENKVFKVLKEANIGPCFLQLDEVDKINMLPESLVVENIDECMASQYTKFKTQHMPRRIKVRKK